MNRTSTDTTEVQNQNTQQITDQKIAASTAYQGDINAALENQAGALQISPMEMFAPCRALPAAMLLPVLIAPTVAPA